MSFILACVAGAKRGGGGGGGGIKALPPSLFPLFSIPYPFRRLLRRLHLSQMVCGAIPFGKLSSVSFLPLPLPPLSLFGSRFISRAVKTESPLPWYFFAPKPNGNACYTGYTQCYILISLFSFVCFVYSLLFGTNCYISFHAFSRITQSILCSASFFHYVYFSCSFMFTVCTTFPPGQFV